uniref:non-specific serine/threonine protein kinase n=1 Tax=Anopheles epiroticus TaxID=199890 RepID=A0A182P4C2_9DIPT
MAHSEAIVDTQTATQTQMTQDTALESQPFEHPSYGQLLGKHVKMKSLDLRHSEFKVGREGTCDLILDENNLPPSKLCRISKLHFTIKKDLNDATSPTYIHDHSRNGTYVNGRLIGPNKCMILKHNDIISIAGVNIRAFIYHDLRHSVLSEIKAKELLDRYHIGRKLGSGACGTVYLLHDAISCQPYAMKHVAKDPLNERSRPKFLNDPLRVMNEVNIMKNLDHPCVIKMHDIVDKPDSVYMVLEYMKGGDLLSRIIGKGYLPEKTAKLFFLQMCHAVKYLHEQGIKSSESRSILQRFCVSPLAKKLIYDILNINPKSRPSIDALLQSSWLRDPDVVGRAEQLMKMPLLEAHQDPAPKRNTASDVENNNASSPVSSFAPPSKRKRRL